MKILSPPLMVGFNQCKFVGKEKGRLKCSQTNLAFHIVCYDCCILDGSDILESKNEDFFRLVIN